MTDAPRRILVVEDDEDLAHAIAEQLVDAGFVVD
jgi:DNA-binding response OmpR family regulator